MAAKVQLSDRYDLSCSTALLNGTQALIRLLLTQREIDRRAGLNTAGHVTGYRGSPLGALDMHLNRAHKELESSDIVFQPALNEDLAATALWGSQQAELRGEGRHDGVFGLWYGKGPGVDRSGDVLRHANFAGTSPYGGVLMALGDDHTGESSTTLHQSEWTLVDAYIPILSPAGVQEILDFGVFGYALSRYSGNWVGIKCMKETIEATSVVHSDLEKINFRLPEFEMPLGGLNIRLMDTPRAQESRTLHFRRFAAEAFGHCNQVDRRVHGKNGATIGIIAAGKNWLDVLHAFELLGIDHQEAEKINLTTYKVGMTWPLNEIGFTDWAEGLDLIVVVEEKRKLIEPQIKDLMFNERQGRRVYGRQSAHGVELFPSSYALDPIFIAKKLGQIFIEEGRITEQINANLSRLNAIQSQQNLDDIASRLPYFCSGCPHNTSTKIPAGSRAYAGIGCHYMVQWMDRDTIGFTHMGGEGANWIGEAPFSRRDHVFQNLGDGTYNHSGIMAIRAAVASKANMTFKLLYNDAVAMTGGQKNDGDLSAGKIAHELDAIGVKKTVIVYDPNEDINFSEFPPKMERQARDQFDQVQRNLREITGVTAILYVQTCAAEKRRRRKRGVFPDPDRRIFINPDVCEGCGDCGVQSNCVSIVPLETELGRKRKIDQSSCNKDFSCLNGFCPSFVTLKGAKVRSVKLADYTIPDLPQPEIPEIQSTHNIVITGVGGTGVVTIGALLAMAAHLDRKGAGMIEMAGLAQKGGAVQIHCRIAKQPQDISAIRVANSEAHCVIGGDLVVTAGTAETMALVERGKTQAVINSHEIITGDFTRDTEFNLPTEALRQRLFVELGEAHAILVDSTELSRNLLGDSIYSNTMLMGIAWQQGALPLSLNALQTAIRLNGAAVEQNFAAFEIGRWIAVDPAAVERVQNTNATSSAALKSSRELSPYEFRVHHLMQHSGKKRVLRYQSLVNRFEPSPLHDAVIRNYHRVLAIKDEYEVARLHLQTVAKVGSEFEDGFRVSFNLAPPFLSGKLPNGRPKKREFGKWMLHVFALLVKLKELRGTRFDIFAYSQERKLQNDFIQTFEQDMEMLLSNPAWHHTEAATKLVELPQMVRGFGPVWLSNYRQAMTLRDNLLSALTTNTESVELMQAAE